MYSYKIGLALVKTIDFNDKGIIDRKPFLIDTIRLFNEKSNHSTVNPKHIGLGENGEDDIIVTKTYHNIVLARRIKYTWKSSALA